MNSHWIKEKVSYTGDQLSPLYAYLSHGVQGDSIIGWRGACDIPTDKIVDGEDLRAGSRICGSDMLHFIVELFGRELFSAVAVQRLLVSIAKDLVFSLTTDPAKKSQLVRKGDDIYWGQKKFNISIASCSAVSSMVHIGFNVSTVGTPVPTAGLEDFDIRPDQFAESYLESVVRELTSIVGATTKVRPL